ncbi:MAG: tetratricopeptide repeat protein [bacterium]|nr:tetratricopeptide repeat protein [bacterium]
MSMFVQFYKSGLELYSGGHYEQALVSLKKALIEQPEFPDVYYTIARIYDELERFPDALSMYDKLLKLTPNDLEILCSFGRTLIKSGDERRGEKMFQKALKLNPRDVKTRTELVRLYQRQHKLGKALRAAEAGVKAMPDNAAFYFMAGDVLRKQKKFSKAQNYFEQCLEIDSNYESAKRGIDACIRALENKGADTHTRTPEQEAREELVIAANLFSSGDYDQAIVRLMDIRNHKGVEREATLLLGLAFTRKGLYKRAHDVFISFLRSHEPDIRVLFNLGMSFNRMGRYEDAMHYLNEALQIDDEYEEALVEMGVACQMTGYHNEAREYFVRALKLDRANPRPYAYLALLAYEYNDSKKVKEFIKRADQSNPDCPETLLVKAAIAVKEERFEEALDPLMTCLKTAPDHFEALKLLGAVRAHLKDYEGAYDCYRAAAALNPADRECSDVLERLAEHVES